MLFADLPVDPWPTAGSSSEALPWSAFVSARAHLALGDQAAAAACWREVLEASQLVVEQIGPWEHPRPAPPPRGQARMSFLTPSGLHFGQGEMGALGLDPLGGGVLQLATVLMQALIAKTKT